MKRVFFDTEFNAFITSPKLISIGMIDETGTRTFYAELSDTYEPSDCSEFVREIVLPLLNGGEALMSLRELRGRLKDWLESFGEPVTLATDSVAWDWLQIQNLFPSPKDWPAPLDPHPLRLNMNYLNDFDRFEEAIERAFAGGLRRHHALDDARANLAGWKAAGGDIETKVAPTRFSV